MNTKLAIDRLAESAPVRDEALAGEAQTPTAHALLERITATPPVARRQPRVRTRRRLVVPALAAAVAVSVLAVAISNGSHGTESAAAATLKKAASVARAQTPLIPGPGQYLYTKSVDAYLDTTVPATGAGTEYSVLVPRVRETWLGPDGGRLYSTSGKPRFLTSRDRARWIAAGRPSLAEAPAEDPLGAAKPLDLPSDPAALYARLQREAAGNGNGVDAEMFTLVGDSLRETSATPEQRAALFQVASEIPGVELVGRVEDTAGRPGIAVARDHDGIRSTLIFDPETSAMLSEEDVALPGNVFGVAPGTRIGYATYLVQAIVNSDTAKP
jgi:hypothetical protein